MSIKEKTLRDALNSKFINSIVDIEDLVGDENHYSVSIVSNQFNDLSLIDQHNLVLDTCKDLMDQNLLHALKINTSTIKEYIENTIKNNRIVLFLKGDKENPMCGFSASVVRILDSLNVYEDIHDLDILQSLELRDGIKKFTNWPTIPQLYVNGKFIGGCDIVNIIYEKGELQKLLQT